MRKDSAVHAAPPDLEKRVADLEKQVERLAAIVAKAAAAIGTFVNADPLGIEKACDEVENEALRSMSRAGRRRYGQETGDPELFADEEEPAST